MVSGRLRPGPAGPGGARPEAAACPGPWGRAGRGQASWGALWPGFPPALASPVWRVPARDQAWAAEGSGDPRGQGQLGRWTQVVRTEALGTGPGGEASGKAAPRAPSLASSVLGLLRSPAEPGGPGSAPAEVGARAGAECWGTVHMAGGGGSAPGTRDQAPGAMAAAGLPGAGRTPAGPREGAASCEQGQRGQRSGRGAGGHSPAGSSRCQVPRSPGKPARACALPVARGATEGPWGRAAGCGLADQAHLLPDGRWPEGRAAAGRQLCAVAGAVWGLVEHLDERQGRAGAPPRAGTGGGVACGSGVRGTARCPGRPQQASVRLGRKRQTETRGPSAAPEVSSASGSALSGPSRPEPRCPPLPSRRPGGRRSAVRTDGSLLNGGTGARPGGQEGTGNGHLE